MITLANYYRAIKSAQTVDDCLLPPVQPTLVMLDDRRLPLTDTEFNERPFDELFNRRDLTAKIDALSPLSMSILGAADAAGYDLPELTYSLSIYTRYVVNRNPWQWHTEGDIRVPQRRQDFPRQARISQTIHSNICPTAQITASAIYARCPPDYDRELFYLGVVDDVRKGGKSKFNWSEARLGFNDGLYKRQRHRRLVDTVHRATQDLMGNCIIPPPASAAHINYATLHAWTCEVVDNPWKPGARQRHRVILTIKPPN